MAYATVAELKSWMDLVAEDEDLDAQLADVLDAATEAVEESCDRTFELSEPEVRTVEVAGSLVFVDDFAELTEVSYDGTTVTAGPQPHHPPRGRPYTALLLSRPRRGTVDVEARWGWPTVPESVRVATMMTALRLWERRQSAYGVQGTGETGFIRITGVDRDVEGLLAPYTRARGRLA